ncbi:unnamed protein product [Strongylus vulgaris]|uniref:ethanolamine kinase n=1 Tax=Strongylus vulgaris TaxID=40348 RepID=A0A3P7JGK6_STRVU|nr:unnamed protein product [Strongylus vulgaris]
MDSTFINIDLSITNQQHCEASAREVYTAGITNKIMSASVDASDKLIFRIFGKNTEKFIDRDRELNAMEKLATRGLAAPVYARFSNGILCGFLPGTTVNVRQLKDLDIQRRICKTMAAFHSLNSTKIETNSMYLFRKTKDFIKNIDMSRAKDIPCFANQLSADLKEMRDLVIPLNEEITFCHNDLLVHNIILEESSGDSKHCKSKSYLMV